MADETVNDAVLRIMGVQSPGYLIHPTATAFVVEGLDVIQVQTALTELETQGKVEEREVVAQKAEPDWIFFDNKPPEPNPDAGKLSDIIGEDGKPVIVDTGWILK